MAEPTTITLNRGIVTGQHRAACLVARLIEDGQAVLALRVLAAGKPEVTIRAPRYTSPLWREAVAFRLTPTEVDYTLPVAGCEVRWTVSRAEHELRRIFEETRT